MEIKDKVILVTGASGRIGSAVSKWHLFMLSGEK